MSHDHGPWVPCDLQGLWAPMSAIQRPDEEKRTQLPSQDTDGKTAHGIFRNLGSARVKKKTDIGNHS